MGKIKVATTSNTNAVAGSIAGMIREHGVVQVDAIGAGAVNQAVKAIAVARGYLAPQGYDIVCIPAFAPATEDEDYDVYDMEPGEDSKAHERTQRRVKMKFIVKPV